MSDPGFTVAVKSRLLVGKLLVVVGIALLILWVYYFVQLVRPIDVWDVCPLPVGFALILIGVKASRRGRDFVSLVSAHLAISYFHLGRVQVFTYPKSTPRGIELA